MIQGMNHFTVLAKDLQATLDFYTRVLDLKEGARPDLGFPGAWLYSGETAVLHVIAGRPVPGPGVIDHMAFTATGLREAKKRLDDAGIQYALRKQVGAGTWQLFCTDPAGARVELDFDPAEEE